MQMNAATGVIITQYVVDGALEMLVQETPISPRTMSAKYGNAGSRPNNGPRLSPPSGTPPTALLLASVIRRPHFFLALSEASEPGQSLSRRPHLDDPVGETASRFRELSGRFDVGQKARRWP
jgi:hypothetical protein